MRGTALAAIGLVLVASSPGLAGEREQAYAAYLAAELEARGFVPLPGASSIAGPDVLGYLPPSDGAAAGERRAIVLGAHDDDLAYAPADDPLAGAEGGMPLPRDTNAAAVLVVFQVVDRLASHERKHPLIVAFWRGTDPGAAESPPRPVTRAFARADRLVACIDLDLAGGLRDDRLEVLGAGTSSDWSGLLERANVPVGLDLRLSDPATLPKDAALCADAEVPVITLNVPPPDASGVARDTLDDKGVERVTKLVTLLVRKLDALEEGPEFRRATPPSAAPPSGGNRRAYTGTIPDYAAEVEGLRLSGVIDGGPAQVAGLAEGDVIVEFAGHPIGDIYDYGKALDEVEVGKPIRVVFVREGERHEVTITPTVRP